MSQPPSYRGYRFPLEIICRPTVRRTDVQRSRRSARSWCRRTGASVRFDPQSSMKGCLACLSCFFCFFAASFAARCFWPLSLSFLPPLSPIACPPCCRRARAGLPGGGWFGHAAPWSTPPSVVDQGGDVVVAEADAGGQGHERCRVRRLGMGAYGLMVRVVPSSPKSSTLTPCALLTNTSTAGSMSSFSNSSPVDPSTEVPTLTRMRPSAS